MSVEPPRPGEVIRYSYLWWNESRQGREEGLKDRPSAVVLTRKTQDNDTLVYVLPITHTPPRDNEHGIEIPSATKHRLGLDDERSWIITTELNKFVWPGYDVRRLPSGEQSYGLLPDKFIRSLLESLRDSLANNGNVIYKLKLRSLVVPVKSEPPSTDKLKPKGISRKKRD